MIPNNDVSCPARAKITQRLTIFVTMSLLSATSLAGGGSTGGGTGCRALFMRSAFEVSQWLGKPIANSNPPMANGTMLSPPVTGDDFIKAVNPNNIVSLKNTQELLYEGEPVDALFDGAKFLVRCDRLQNDTSDARRSVVAHEIFRKMGLDGDGYEESRQIPILSLPEYSEEAFPDSSFISLRGGVIGINNSILVPAQSTTLIFQGNEQVIEEGMDWSKPFCIIALSRRHEKSFTLTARKLKITKVNQLEDLQHRHHYFVGLITAEDQDINSVQCGEKEILPTSGREPTDQEVGLGLDPTYIKSVMHVTGHFSLEGPKKTH